MDFQIAGCAVSGTKSDLARFSLISKQVFDTLHVETLFASAVNADFLVIPWAVSSEWVPRICSGLTDSVIKTLMIFTTPAYQKKVVLSRL